MLTSLQSAIVNTPMFGAQRRGRVAGPAGLNAHKQPVGLQRDVFFRGNTPPAEPEDAVTLKNGSRHSLNQVMGTMDQLQGLVNMLFFMGAVHFFHHLLEIAKDQPGAEFCEATKPIAKQTGILDDKGQVPQLIKDVAASSISIQPTAQGVQFSMDDPLQVSMQERMQVAQRLVAGNRGAVPAVRQLLEKGDKGLDAMHNLEMFDLTGEGLKRGFEHYAQGDVSALIRGIEDLDSSLLAFSAFKDAKPGDDDQ